jgi:capsular polysaccharide transport system permease protein
MMSDSPQKKEHRAEPDIPLGLFPTPSADQIVRDLHRKWARKIAWRISWFVGLPTVLASIYFAFWASNQYESVTIIAVRGVDLSNGSHSESWLGSAVGTNGNSREVLSIRDYILSRSMLESLAQSQRYVQHFQDQKWDAFSRLAKRTTREQTYQFYLGKVAADYDSASGSLTLRVRAFDPERAREFARAIVTQSESLVADLAGRASQDARKYAETQMTHARERLVLARSRVTETQHRSATRSAGVYPNGKLQGRPTPVDESPSDRFRNVDETLDTARLERDYAEKAYQLSILAMDETSVNGARRQQGLITIAKPSLPDYSTYPRRLASVVTVFVFSFLIMGIVSLTLSAIREHARV